MSPDNGCWLETVEDGIVFHTSTLQIHFTTGSLLCSAEDSSVCVDRLPGGSDKERVIWMLQRLNQATRDRLMAAILVDDPVLHDDLQRTWLPGDLAQLGAFCSGKLQEALNWLRTDLIGRSSLMTAPVFGALVGQHVSRRRRENLSSHLSRKISVAERERHDSEFLSRFPWFLTGEPSSVRRVSAP
ncbi:hypothetical protein JYT15_00755 [Acidimicrobium ferrooxidans]|nr:hypothetical protein [Acidimicrobium ferrooxidans]